MSDLKKQTNTNTASSHPTLALAETFETAPASSFDVDDVDVETGAAVVTNIDWSATELSGSSPKNKHAKGWVDPPNNQSNRCGIKSRIGWIILGGTAIAMFFIGLSIGWTTKNDKGAVTVEVEADAQDVPSTSNIVPDDASDINISDNGPDADMDQFKPDYLFNLTSSSDEPTKQPAPEPSMEPTPAPSSAPTSKPSSSPTQTPTTGSPTTAPTPKNPYFFGEGEFVTVEELGIEMSQGLTVRLISQAGKKVQYANGEESENSWHEDADAAGIVPLDPANPLDGGYVYMSNSEEGDGDGGVHGLYFDKDGNIMDYKALLTGTSDNCGGGLTPWNTWVSCEESGSNGQCWQVDPINDRAEETKLGGDGGNYESVAVDNRIPENPVFFTTEDEDDGALRRFVAQGSGWDALHSDGDTTFLNILDDDTFEWTDKEDKGRKSAKKYFPNTEGIQVHEDKVYFMSKTIHTMFILDLEDMTYETEETGVKFYGEGSFGEQPDQNMFGPTRKYIYFTEDGGSSPGVYARYGTDATYFTLFQAIEGGMHDGDETSGIALSPDHKRFYACIQHNGYCFEFMREDGLSFE